MNKLTACCKKSKYAAKKEMGRVEPIAESEEVTASLEKLNELEIHFKKTKKAFRAFQKSNKAAVSAREKSIKVLEAAQEQASGDCKPEFAEMCEFMETTKGFLEHQSTASKQHFTEPLAMLLVEIDTCVRLRSKYKKARLAYETNHEYLEKQRAKDKSEGKIRTAQKELEESETALEEISQKIVDGVKKIEDMRDTTMKDALRQFLDESKELYPGHAKQQESSEEDEEKLDDVVEEEKESDQEREGSANESEGNQEGMKIEEEVENVATEEREKVADEAMEKANDAEEVMEKADNAEEVMKKADNAEEVMKKADNAEDVMKKADKAEEAMKKADNAEGTGLKMSEVQEAN